MKQIDGEIVREPVEIDIVKGILTGAVDPDDIKSELGPMRET